jgi:predicted phage terminase large subunit-like protein
MSVTALEAARELQRRRTARESAIAFAEVVDVPGRAVEDDDETEPLTPVETKLALHHKLILREMEDCAERDTGRLMLFLPPGSAKSTYASVVFPAHYMGRRKGKRLGLFSYGDTLATKMGRRTRSIIKQPRYRGIHNAELSNESKAVDNFTLTNGSEYMACGILSGVTGNRLDMVIIDDPIKGREQANSETIRNKTFDAYEDDIKTRLVPGGSLVLIQTRWHEDDLAGRILPDGWNGESGDILCKDGNVWRIVCIQAECEVDDDPLGRKRGEYLWPEWFTQKHWNQYKSNPRTWGALYQQRPSPLDGDLFTPGAIEVIDTLPAGRITWVRGWDLASVQGGGDWTAGVKLGRHESGLFIIADVARAQLGPDKRDALIKNTATQDGKGCIQDIPQDPGQAGKTQIVAFGKLLVGYIMKFSSESGDKITRAEPAATQVNIGNVKVLRGNWNTAFFSELRTFPNGTWDDQVDGFSRAFARLLLIAGKMKISKSILQRVKR